MTMTGLPGVWARFDKYDNPYRGKIDQMVPAEPGWVCQFLTDFDPCDHTSTKVFAAQEMKIVAWALCDKGTDLERIDALVMSGGRIWIAQELALHPPLGGPQRTYFVPPGGERYGRD